MKRRGITAAVVMAILMVLSLLGAYNLDRVAGGHPEECSWSLLVSLTGLGNRKVLIFFLLFLTLSAAAVLFMLFEHSYINYKSEMQTVTPAIKTPKAEGQGQYGTARWMEKDEIPDAFTVVQIDRNNPLICRLMDEGRLDLTGERDKMEVLE
ncbi:MAG: hypothetical protein AAGU32_06600 [Bacillota bacterium]